MSMAEMGGEWGNPRILVSGGFDKDEKDRQIKARGRRKCVTPGCGTVLRESNDSDVCSPCREGKRLGAKPKIKVQLVGLEAIPVAH
jgi:hypothetical protein